jgi:hypothetical protein
MAPRAGPEPRRPDPAGKEDEVRKSEPGADADHQPPILRSGIRLILRREHLSVETQK